MISNLRKVKPDLLSTFYFLLALTLPQEVAETAVIHPSATLTRGSGLASGSSVGGPHAVCRSARSISSWRNSTTSAALFARPFLAMSNAKHPATCGEAILVPLIVFSPPSFQVDRMSTPGAARSMAAPSEVTGFPGTTLLLKLVKPAKVSSSPPTGTWAMAPRLSVRVGHRGDCCYLGESCRNGVVLCAPCSVWAVDVPF